MKNLRLSIQKYLGIIFLIVSLGIQAQKKPNILIIHTDEHNFRTLSCYRDLLSEEEGYVWGKGAGPITTNIDRLANEGAIAMNYYASSPVCAPSRAAMITGNYRQRTNVLKNGIPIRKDIKTFGHILAENGYATSYVGKWHLGSEKEKYLFGPDYNGGFEDNRYMMSGGHSPYFYIKGDKVKSVNEKSVNDYDKKDIIHLTDYFTNKTIEIMERDKAKLFCVMVSIPDPHTPDVAPAPYDKMYDNMEVHAPESMSPENIAKRPIWAKSEKNDAKGFNAKALRQYFGMVKNIDDNVGRMLSFLDDNNLTENTIVIFTSDHGDMFFEHNRLNKGICYEASAKIPYVVRYPKKIRFGKVIRKAYTNVDFAPTILGMIGIETNVKFDGLDTSEDFFNKEKIIVDDRITHIAEANQIWIATVSRKYKLVVTAKDSPWLFDLENDPHEYINQYNKPGYKEASELMMKTLKQRMKDYNEPILLQKKPIILE